MLKITNYLYVGWFVVKLKPHVYYEVTSGRRLAMNHRLSGIISIEHSIFRNWTMQSGWVISRLAGCTNRASNYLYYICKRSSTSEQAIICFGVRTENKTHVLPARM